MSSMLFQRSILKLNRLVRHKFTPCFNSLHTESSVKAFDPEQIVEALDKHIIGQSDAKRAVAIAFRNRFRRRLLEEDVQKEITPANILMKGPTGCGKTEIARRISSLAQAPFVKVEATRYTEVGIVGANTNSMIKDLLDIAIVQERERAAFYCKDKAYSDAAKEVLKLLELEHNEDNLKKLEVGELDQAQVEMPNYILIANKRSMGRNRGGNNGSDSSDMSSPDEMISNALGTIFVNLGGNSSGRKGGSRSGTDKSDKKTAVKEAMKNYIQYFTDQSIDENDIINAAKQKTEQEGIVFIDEIDKLARGGSGGGGGFVRSESLREGVQKELLSLLEGTSVNTRYGPISTNHILFIASGAFHTSAVTDLLPELQGRLPVRVELKSLDMNDLKRVLSEKKYNLIQQVTALLKTEHVTLQFTDDGITEIARLAYHINTSKGNIGARRLTSVVHSVIEDISYIAHRLSGTTQVIDKAYVNERMKKSDPTAEENYKKYIL